MIQDATKSIGAVIEAVELPQDAEFLQSLISEDRLRFEVQESDLWDYKDRWPFSYSDDYCGGIVRLILSYHNTFGGIIIFGVDAESGESSRSKVSANIERLNGLLRTHVDQKIVCVHRQYELEEFGPVDILLVPPKRVSDRPARLKTAIGRYEPGTIWIRRSHEVLEAGPQDLTLLYGAESRSSDTAESGGALLGYLPPRPSTLKHFVGRMRQMDSLFDWLLRSDEPRMFLFGRGGSGKTTIAYEFANFVRSYGSRLVNDWGAAYDIVLFVSAKEKGLNPLDQGVHSVAHDFESEHELLNALLILSEYTQLTEISSLTVEESRHQIKEMMDSFSCLFVIDDVDTLTTKGVDVGFEYLFRVACKAKKNTKLLYTLRNAPTQSLSNSIEVPGLEVGKEFDDFVSTCADQFKVEIPKAKPLLQKFQEVTERRPLIVETVMGMRRACPSYERALELFQERGGDAARRYTFSREWGALSANNQGRNVLAAIALYGRPIRPNDLASILKMDEQAVMESVLAVQEMFLVRESDDEDTKFSMGKLTKDFVLGESKSLTYYENIAARVKLYKQHEYKKPPAVAALEIRCVEAVKSGHAAHALHLLQSAGFAPAVTEHPSFLALSGWVHCNLEPPNLTAARESFEACIALNAEIEARYLHSWFWAERKAGFGGAVCDKICRWVTESQHYDQREKAAFALRAAILQFERAKDLEFISPTDARGYFRSSLRKHLDAFDYHLRIDGGDFARSYKYTRDTAFKYFAEAIYAGVPDEIFDFWATIKEEESGVSCGPLTDGMSYALKLMDERTKGDQRRLLGRLTQLRDFLQGKRLYFDIDEDRTRLIGLLEQSIQRRRVAR